MSGGRMTADGTAMINLLGGGMLANQWIRELTINAEDYGDEDTLLVFSPVWDAVRTSGVYWAGGWTDTVFPPEKLAAFMPELGKGDMVADPDGNFHCGMRISTLTWTNLVAISRPDPTGPTYVAYLYLDEDPASPMFNEYRYYEWTYQEDPDEEGNAPLHENVSIIPAEYLTQDEVDLLGFDPLKAVDDEGWTNRLRAAGKSNVPVTLFVLQGRNGADTYGGNDVSNKRPVTRSVFNDRIWKAPVETWAWEIGKPDQRDTWLTEPPDGKTVNWKVDESHQWRRNYGLSHIVRPLDRGKSRLLVNETVTYLDGTEFEVYVIDPDVASLDNDQYSLVRRGGFVVDFNGENYHHGSNVVGFGVFNAEIARNTVIRIVPPTRKRNRGLGVLTDVARTTLLWQNGTGGNVTNLDRKLDEWKHWFNNDGGMPDALEALLEASVATGTGDPRSLEDLKDLAIELGDLYNITGKQMVPVVVPGPSKPRHRRQIPPCPECGANLPLPGHVVGCSRKPKKATPAPPIPPGELDHTGDEDDTPRGRKGRGGSNVTILREEEVTIPVGFPEIVPVDYSTLKLPYEFLMCDWVAPNPTHPRGRILVGWGATKPGNDRHPMLQVTVQRLAARWGVTSGPKMLLVEDAVWRACERLLAGSSGHFKGQSKTYAALDTLWNTAGADEIRWGVTWTLMGIEHIERFATPILSKVLGKALSGTTAAKTPRKKKTA